MIKGKEPGKSVVEELDLLFRARFTLIHVTGGEEIRALDMLKRACALGKRNLYAWDSVNGGYTVRGKERKFEKTKGKPFSFLEQLVSVSGRSVFVMLDLEKYWSRQPDLERMVKIVVDKLRETTANLVILSAERALPEQLMFLSTEVRVESPQYGEMLDLLEKVVGRKMFAEIQSGLREKLAKTALGFQQSSAINVFAKALLMFGTMDERALNVIIDEKKRLIRRSGILDYFDTSETIDSIGGLSKLKEWLTKREKALTEEAHDYGLPPPRGLLLIGVQGTGKSLTAKAISNLWRLPLLKFDVGKVFGSLVGQSEEKMRMAISLAETVSPCLLWVDEIDKSFAGVMGSGRGDSGTSARVFGTFVTWMQEKKSPVFVVATANNVRQIPPELLRKGRFDEIFFIDLPTVEERKDVFRIHLEKVRPVIRGYNLDVLSEKSSGFSGAEIEQVVIDAMFNAFDDGKRDFTTEDIIESIEATVPLSRFMHEDVQSLRQWAKGRARSAS